MCAVPLKPLKDFIAPRANDLHSSIDVTTMESHKLKPALVNMVQKNQFVGLPNEDPYLHLSIFIGICDTIKINIATEDVIRLRLFPFSFRDWVRAWLYSLAPQSITKWSQLSEAFLAVPLAKPLNLGVKSPTLGKEMYVRLGICLKNYLGFVLTMG